MICSSMTLSVSFMTGLSCPLFDPLCDCPIATVRTVFDGVAPIVEIAGGGIAFSVSWGAAKGEVILGLLCTSEALMLRPNCGEGSAPIVGDAIFGSVGVGLSS